MLLGAGASSDAGVPTALDMTSEMVRIFREREDESHQRALAALIGALQMGPQPSGKPILWDVDIERVMNAATLLATRFNAELAPFVGAWHPVLDELERLDLEARDVAKITEAAASRAHRLRGGLFDANRGDRDPGAAIADAIVGGTEAAFKQLAVALARRPDGAFFGELAAMLGGKLIQLTWLRDTRRVRYLDPLVECGRDRNVCVATLNYDNAVELCANQLGIACQTGIETWITDRSLSDLPKGVDLIKLHGSIDWWWPEPDRAAPLTYRMLQKLDADTMHEILQTITTESPRNIARRLGDRLALIFGGHNKLTAEGPFIELLTKFRRLLHAHQHLLVVGYSFRDDHVNQCILDWLHQNDAARVTILERQGAKPENCIFFTSEYGQRLGDRLTFRSDGAAAGIAAFFGSA